MFIIGPRWAGAAGPVRASPLYRAGTWIDTDGAYALRGWST